MLKSAVKFILLFIAFLCIFYVGRKVFLDKKSVPEAIEANPVEAEQSLPKDFHTFYDQFHTDSLFQMERIVFPLKGIGKLSDTSSIAQEIMWQREDWVLHKPFNRDGSFERVFTNISGIITEYISSTNGMFSMEKRYAKLGGEWHLIYYQELLMTG